MATLTREGYLANLLHIREVLIDELDNLNKKQNTFYIAEIAIKLRILFLDKSDTEALLKTIENLYGFKINVLVGSSLSEDIEKGPSLVESLVFNQINSVVSWFGGGHGNKEKVSIFEGINKKEIIINKNQFSYKDIIEIIADKMGGAHIDKSIPDEKLIPFFNDILVGGLSPAFRAIYDLANASIMLINMIENYIYSPFDSQFLIKN